LQVRIERISRAEFLYELDPARKVGEKMIQGSFVLLDRLRSIVAVEREELFYRSLNRGAAGVDGVLEFIDGESLGGCLRGYADPVGVLLGLLSGIVGLAPTTFS
jgi:hypothetical protein